MIKIFLIIIYTLITILILSIAYGMYVTGNYEGFSYLILDTIEALGLYEFDNI